MPDIKIVDNALFEETGRLNVYLNYNKLKQLKNQHAEIDKKKWVEILNHFKNEHIPYENSVILFEFTLCCPGTNGSFERVFSVGNFWTSEKSRLNDDISAVVLTVKIRSTASDLSRQPSSATGTTVSRQTVYRRLEHISLHARKPVRCVPLTATHCRLRFTWSREHALWTPQQWSYVMFSYESRFSLLSDSRRTLIWRAPGTRYHQANTIERHRYGGAGWLVRGGIILGS
ncbi:transposable element Tcb1 transposase [Trichonephila clavipes]|nr:transposable element Tcb1 transposase [Trichonephila clavipes]